jgi:hypothetical protein
MPMQRRQAGLFAAWALFRRQPVLENGAAKVT